MASWFYLYLYTEHPQRLSTNVVANVRKETQIMSNRAVQQIDVTIDEGTSHWIAVTVKDEDGSAMDLAGCSAVFTSGLTEKVCDIENNIVEVKLEPDETVGFLSTGYQIRVFDSNEDVLQIIQGILYIRKAHKPYTQNPLGGE